MVEHMTNMQETLGFPGLGSCSKRQQENNKDGEGSWKVDAVSTVSFSEFANVFSVICSQCCLSKGLEPDFYWVSLGDGCPKNSDYISNILFQAFEEDNSGL